MFSSLPLIYLFFKLIFKTNRNEFFVFLLLLFVCLIVSGVLMLLVLVFTRFEEY